MSVYFITCREANAVKIGSSLEPWTRLPELQSYCPLLLTVEAILPGGLEEERQYHSRFADDRLRGEWFTINEMMELIIQLNPAPPPKPKAACEPRKGPRRGRRNDPPSVQYDRQIERSERKRYAAAMAEMQAASA